MSIADQARQIYETRLREECEASHMHRFVAIEPVSAAYFIADQFVDAALAAKNAYPERQSFVIRIGHEAAFHIGACGS